MKVEKIGNTNHAKDLDGAGYTLCGLTTSGDDSLRITDSIKTTGKITCKKCIEIIDYCVELKVQMKKEINEKRK
jgi:hypothetical protein